MYAIVVTGGKQYRVAKDQVLSVEKLNVQVGDQISLNAILYSDGENMVVGNDASKISIKAEVLEHGKGTKLNIFTYKAKKNIRKRQGHRQPYTKLKIVDVSVG